MSTTRGRPRGFDREAALAEATRLFRERGYEATSIGDLTRALGISPPSLYAAFGSKRELFRAVVERYQAVDGAEVFAAFDRAPSAREGTEAMLRAAARDYTDPSHPPGCLIISAATNCGEESADVREELAGLRRGQVARMSERVRTDVAAGLLPGDADPDRLASFYGAVLQGMSARSRDGATREDLESIAEMAMAAWPATPVGDAVPAADAVAGDPGPAGDQPSSYARRWASRRGSAGSAP